MRACRNLLRELLQRCLPPSDSIPVQLDTKRRRAVTEYELAHYIGVYEARRMSAASTDAANDESPPTSTH
jgi:hypothetical protein